MATFEALAKTRLTIALNNSDTSVLFTGTRRRDAVNEGMEEFADLTECYLRRRTITISCNVSEYVLTSTTVGIPSTGAGAADMSTDFVRLAQQSAEYRVRSSGGSTARYVTYLTGDDFPQRTVGWLNREYQGWPQSTSPRVPTGFYLRADGGELALGLDAPPLVKSSEIAQILVPYVAKPERMTSTGDLPYSRGSATRPDLIPYHQALTDYAAAKLLPLVGDETGAQAAIQRFLGYVQRYLSFMRPKGGRFVSMHRDYLRDARRRGRDDDRDARLPPSQWS